METAVRTFKKRIFIERKFEHKLQLVKWLKEITRQDLKTCKDYIDCNTVILEMTDTVIESFNRDFEADIRNGLIRIEDIQACMITDAKQAVYYHSECVLLEKDEYQELCKYKGLYLDLKGSLEGILKENNIEQLKKAFSLKS